MYVLTMLLSLTFVVIKTPHLFKMIQQRYKQHVKKQSSDELNIYSQFEVNFLGLSTVDKAKRGEVTRLKSFYNNL